MTNDFITVTIYGQEEHISPNLLPYISESALECEPPPHNRMDEARRRVEDELSSAERRLLLRRSWQKEFTESLLLAHPYFSATDELTFELGWLACKLNLFTPDGF